MRETIRDMENYCLCTYLNFFMLELFVLNLNLLLHKHTQDDFSYSGQFYIHNNDDLSGQAC